MSEDKELSRGRKIAFSCTAIALFLVVLAALGEAAVRFIMPKSDAVKLGIKLEGSARLYGLQSNHRSVQTGVVVQTNSMGFREKEYPIERRPGVRRIAVIGDSYTFGYGVEFPEIFSKRLENELNRSAGPYEVINFGVPGYNTSVELATFRESSAQFKPDLVIVGYVLNDTEIQDQDRSKDAAGGEGGTSIVNAAHLAVKDVSMLYRFIAPKLGALAGTLFNARYAVGGTKEIIRSFEDDAPGWVESRNALLEIAEEARRIGAPTLVVVFPMMVDSYPLAAAHHKITAFCRKHGIAVLDLMSTLEGQKVSEMVVVLDGHPNGRMHQIFADRIYQYLSHNYAPLRNELEAAQPGVARPMPARASLF